MSTSKTSRAASALKSGVGGVVLGGTAIFSAMNGFTPHMAGAIDIMVVEQPDGSLKCSPFYVRFGKYAPMRAKDKVVRISVNGEEAPFSMHLGAYGQAYFAAETTEIVSDPDDDDEDMLEGMMSPPSGYSSADEVGAPFANEAMLTAVKQEVERLKRSDAGAASVSGATSRLGPQHLQQEQQEQAAGDKQQEEGKQPAAEQQPTDAIPGKAGQAAGGTTPAPLEESSSDLSDSDASAASTSAAPASVPLTPAVAPPAAQLPPLPPSSPLLQRRGSLTRAAAGGGGAAAVVEAAAAASSAAKASMLAQPAAGPLEDMLLDSKYSVAAADSTVLQELQAERACPGHDRAQHAWSVRNRSVTQGHAEPIAESSAAPAATGAAASAGAEDALVEVKSLGEDLDAVGSSSGGGGAAAKPAADAASQQQPDKGEGKGLAVNVAQPGEGAGKESSGSGSGEDEVTSPLKPVVNGLLASSLKAHDEAVAAAAAAAAAEAPATEAPAAAAVRAAEAAPPAPRAATPPPEVSRSTPVAPAASEPVPISSARSPQAPQLELPLGVSPGDAGYLADSEGPRTGGGGAAAAADAAVAQTADAAAAATAAAVAVPQAHSGMMALGGQGFHMSLCGHLLRPGMPAAEALQLFEAHRVSASAWAVSGTSLTGNPSLVVRVGGVLYPWSAAGPMVLGMLAFGGPWQEVVPTAAEGGDAWHPLRVAEDRPVGGGKKAAGDGTTGGATPTGAGSSSWRLWPFSGWRDGGGSSSTAGGAKAVTGGGGTPPGTKGDASTRGGSSPPVSGLLSVAAAAGLSLPLSRAGSIGGASGTLSPRRAAAAAAATAAAGAEQQKQQQPPQPRPRRHIVIIRKTLMPTPEQLASLPLRFGSNTISFRCSAGGSAPLTAYVYYYPWNSRLVISDVDGTITRSDLLGHVLPTLGVSDWSHPGITQLFHNVAANGYQIMFLSSRAISQANITREYLHKLVQDGYKMPTGPVIISPHGLLPSLYREIVQRRPHEFKIACLEDIRALFPPSWNPFYAGFGNRDTDVVSYREVGVPPSRTFIINPKGQICKGSALLQSSSWSSLSAINQLVDEVFPAVQEMLDVMRGANGGMRAAAHAVIAAERLRSATSGTLAGGQQGKEKEQQQEQDQQQQDKQQQEQDKQQQQQAGEQQAGEQQEQLPTGAQSPAASESVSAGGALAAAARAARRLIAPTAVGPQRDEFNDAQFWRTTFSFDIESELQGIDFGSRGGSKSGSRRASFVASSVDGGAPAQQ